MKEMSEICVGMFAFADHKFSDRPGAYQNLQGVVCWVNPDKNAPDGKKGLIVSIEEKKCEWAVKSVFLGIDSEEDGKLNTNNMILLRDNEGLHFEAMEFCSNFHKHAISKEEAFLPAKLQMQRILRQSILINKSLAKVGAKPLNGAYWTSSEYDLSHAWIVFTNSKYVCYGQKRFQAKVRYCLPF